ncbi:transmembrane and death domain protein 1 [Petaurus breviceps papuanus]|uniref:transmembrane and death domain protein 1 n=1 Tax=Petaurus breviceps papuanus TaxID=3040969 RepID=UPI0036DB51E8
MEVCRWLRAPLLALVLVGVGGWMMGLAEAEDSMGPHMAVRLAEMLTPEECELFRALLAAPEPDPEAELARLSEDRRPPDEEPGGHKGRKGPRGWRWRREVGEQQSLDSVGVCRKELASWLAAKAPALEWDRVARVLRRCGRPDVARELAKSLHQEAMLELRRFAQPYREAAAAQAAPAQPLQPRAAPPDRDAQDAWDSWDAWDELILERLPQARYPRDPADWVHSMAFSFLRGFMGAFVLGMLIILLMLCLTGLDQDEIHDRDYWPESPSSVSVPLLRSGGPDSLWEIKTLP